MPEGEYDCDVYGENAADWLREASIRIVATLEALGGVTPDRESNEVIDCWDKVHRALNIAQGSIAKMVDGVCDSETRAEMHRICDSAHERRYLSEGEEPPWAKENANV